MATLWTAPAIRSLADAETAFAKLYAFFRAGAVLPYHQPRFISAAATLRETDRLTLCDTTGGAFALTLPLARTTPPQIYAVKLLAGANNVTLTRTSPDEIWTSAAVTTLAFNTTGMTKLLVPGIVDGATTWGWVVVGSS